MQKITPFLWFNDNAEEAVRLYTSLFKNSKTGKVARYGKSGEEVSGMKAGSVMTVEFELEGQKFIGLNGGPHFKFNPSISFIVGCETEEEVNRLWQKLSEKGKTLMALDKYPFSDRYGWTEDKYGVSWQLILTKPEGEDRPKIVPSLLFVGEKSGKTEEAIGFYTSIFKNSRKGTIAHYGKGQEPNKEKDVMFGDFMIENYWLTAMDSALKHNFTFNEAISFLVNCKDQNEIDHYWEKLSAHPKSEMCGWLKDKYGVSWQIVPEALGEMLHDKDPVKSERVMKAMLKMSKIDIKVLKDTHEGKGH